MRQRGRIAACVAVILAVLAPAAGAHIRKPVGPLAVELGWRDEPAYSGLRNAVEVAVTDADGGAVSDPRASLRAEVSFGESRTELALRPAGGTGRYGATLVPTQPGVYRLRVTGTVRGRRVDVAATCSERTFDCVQGPGAIQFPRAEPSGSQLDLKLDRALARAARVQERADRAQGLALGALGAAGVAILAALGLGLRRGRRA